MRFIAGTLNNQRLQNLLGEVIGSCTRVCAAVAYVKRDNMQLFEACVQHQKSLEFFGRYDHTVAIAPEVLKWFLDQKSPQYICRLVPDILHAKVIWWEGAGAYIGSANLSQRAWDSNIEAGIFLPQDELIEADMESELQQFFDVVREHARPLNDEIYKEQKQLAERRKDLSMRDYGIEQQFEESRLLPKNGGLNFSEVKQAARRRRVDSKREWNEKRGIEWLEAQIQGSVKCGAQLCAAAWAAAGPDELKPRATSALSRFWWCEDGAQRWRAQGTTVFRAIEAISDDKREQHPLGEGVKEAIKEACAHYGIKEMHIVYASAQRLAQQIGPQAAAALGAILALAGKLRFGRDDEHGAFTKG